jgi:hypothetical protein
MLGVVTGNAQLAQLVGGASAGAFWLLHGSSF